MSTFLDQFTFDNLEESVKSDTEKKAISLFKNQRGINLNSVFSETSNQDNLKINHFKKTNEFE